MRPDHAPLTLEAERALVARLRRREEAAFRELVARFQGRVYGVAYRLLGDVSAAQDATQEVFMSAFQALDRFRGDARLGTWLLRIAMNRAKNKALYFARRVAAPLPDPDARVGSEPSPEQALLGQELEGVLQRALGALTVEARALVVLRDVEGLSYLEIGQVTDLPEGTVKSKLHRARLQLKATVEAYTAAPSAAPPAAPSAATPSAATPSAPPAARPLALAAALHVGEPHHD